MSVECPSTLGFHRPLTSLVKETILVRNPNNRPVAFKVKTTAPKQYCVRPNSGRIEPGQEVEVQVLLQAMKEDPAEDFKCRDKFLVQSTIITPDHESSGIPELWAAMEQNKRQEIHEKKIRCAFLPREGSAVPRHSIEPSRETSGSPAPAYHAADSSIQDSYSDGVPQKLAPALATASNGDNTGTSSSTTKSAGVFQATAGSSKDPLQEAKAEITRLKQQLEQATSRNNKSVGGVKAAVAKTEGVPVPIAAGVALIAFLLAYLLF